MKITKVDIPNYPVLQVDLSDEHIKLLYKYIREANKIPHPKFGSNWVDTLEFSGDCVTKRKPTFINDLMELVDTNNEFLNDVIRPVIKAYQKISELGVENLVQGTDEKKQPYMQRFWARINTPDEYAPAHYHNGVFSFVAYLQVPTNNETEQQTDPQGSDFILHYSNILGLPEKLNVKMHLGAEHTMLFFPSRMMHEVYASQYNHNLYRVCVSGDIV